MSGFNYRLKLPAAHATANNDKLKTEINPLDLAALRIKPFKYVKKTAYGQIGENKMLLLSLKSELEMFAEMAPIDRTLKI